jgi:hypothetical protein
MKSKNNKSSASTSSPGQLPSQPSETSLPTAVQATLEDLRRKLNLPPVGRFFMETLTPQEAKRIEVELVRGRKIAEPSTLQMWFHLHHGDYDQGLVDLAHRCDLITSGQHERLQRSLSLLGKPSRNERDLGVKHESPKPSWDDQTGKFYYDGQLVRKVRIMPHGQMHKLLGEFEKQGWPTAIKYPPELNAPATSLVRSLNSLLKRIKFRSRIGNRRGEELVYWETVN